MADMKFLDTLEEVLLERGFPLDIVQKVLETAQTVDAVEVIRCRECKHCWHYGKTSLFINGKNIKAGWCRRRIRYDEEYRMTADDFCSYGELKDGDK